MILRYTGPDAPQPPSCSETSAITGPEEAVSVPLTCSDPNGNPLTRTIVTPPADGTLGEIEGDSVTYTPDGSVTSGTDTFEFAASDGAATSAAATATVTVGPDTKITKKPKKKTTKRKAKFKFTSTVPDSSFECKLDKGKFKSCDSPFKKRVDVGKHKFKVRAVAQGKTDQTPAKRKWRVKEEKKGGK